MEVTVGRFNANSLHAFIRCRAYRIGLIVLVLLFLSGPVLAEVVNLNTADANALQHYLYGIGAKKADAIVAYRKEKGPFATVDDLTKVPGVGKGLLEKNRQSLSLTSGASTVSLRPGSELDRKAAERDTKPKASSLQAR